MDEKISNSTKRSMYVVYVVIAIVAVLGLMSFAMTDSSSPQTNNSSNRSSAMF